MKSNKMKISHKKTILINIPTHIEMLISLFSSHSPAWCPIGKISNLKLGILAQCTLLLLVILGFLFKEFVIPATKNISSPSLITDKDHINIDQETWDKLIKNKK